MNNAVCSDIVALFKSRLVDAHGVLNIGYFNKNEAKDADAYVILLSKDQKLNSFDLGFDEEKIKEIEFFLKNKEFSYSKSSSAALPIFYKDKYINLFFYGVNDLKVNDLELLGKRIYNKLLADKSSKVVVFSSFSNEYEAVKSLSLGMSLNRFRFDLKNKKSKLDGEENSATDKKSLDYVKFVVKSDNLNALSDSYKVEISSLVKAINISKAYCDGPANIIYPESLAHFIDGDFKDSKLGIEVEILDEKKMASLGMGALLGVGQGAHFKPRLVVMKWNGDSSDSAPLLFVGKGITFDSGGLSIKPADSMETMKYDMSGASTVAGLMRVLAERKAKVNAVGIIALAENAVGGGSQRPGDIVMSMSGKTIEVLNTDAEGRLVLADALTYGQTKLGQKPALIVDLATLTGAAIVALGSNSNAAILSNNKEISDKLIECGERANEKLWPLPLGEIYADKMKSNLADIQNISRSRGWGAGTITAAEFLKEFIEDGMKWAHLDIAGVDNYSANSSDGHLRGSAAFGIKLLNEFVQGYEKK